MFPLFPCSSSGSWLRRERFKRAAFAPRKGLRMLNAMTRRPAISDDSEPSWESPFGDFAGTPEFRGFHQSSRLFSEKRPLMRLWPDREGWCLFCMMSVLLLEAMEIPRR